MTDKLTRPLLRYHGGKWRLAPWLLSLFPPHRIYVEPFGGGASVLLQKDRTKSEIYNDLDREIVNVFRVMRDSAPALIDKLRLTPFAREEFMGSFKSSKDPIEQARRTIVRSFMSYGTTFLRRNLGDGEIQKTGFRVQRRDKYASTANDWAGLMDHFEIIARRLTGVVIENRPAIDVCLAHDSPETLFYVDPPYVHSTRQRAEGGSKSGYRHEMDDQSHRDLGAVLNTLQGMVILSGYACDLYDRELFKGWVRLDRTAWTINAGERKEIIWMRNVPRDLFSMDLEREGALAHA